MRDSIAQMTLDLLGDLLSKYTQTKDRGVVTNSDWSFIYPSRAHLENSDQMDSKSCPRFFFMSYGGLDFDHDYSDVRH